MAADTFAAVILIPAAPDPVLVNDVVGRLRQGWVVEAVEHGDAEVKVILRAPTDGTVVRPAKLLGT